MSITNDRSAKSGRGYWGRPNLVSSLFCNLNIEDVPLSAPLKHELEIWIRQYGEWIDWKNNGIFRMALN